MEENFNFPNIQLSLDYINKIERMYNFEESLMLAVQKGDVNEVKNIFEKHKNLSELSSHMVKRLPNDLLRFQKNNHVILNTLLRTAAKKGGLSIIYLHTISEKFALAIESATSVNYLLNTLSPTMCIEYAAAVTMFSTKGYSPLIKEVIRYITSNITIDICLSTLAEQFHVNPSYLSRKFKEDTKMTITSYINYQRVELAKFYFEKNIYNITEIAHKVGYNDSSYFTKIFKKITGMLPKEYIDNLNKQKEDAIS